MQTRPRTRVPGNGVFGRLVDIAFSLVCLAVLLPAWVVIALLIKIDSPGPIFFKQKRVGKNGRPYSMYKFRSMLVHAQTPEKLGPLKHTHALITPVGSFLRRSKIDEVPQFINVLRGEMSVFGPRPCLPFRLETMSAEEKKRFSILPGITGWAETNGNVELTWEEQLLLDLWYVAHKSAWLDIKILLKTVVTVLCGSIRNELALQQAKNYSILRLNGEVLGHGSAGAASPR